MFWLGTFTPFWSFTLVKSSVLARPARASAARWEWTEEVGAFSGSGSARKRSSVYSSSRSVLAASCFTGFLLILFLRGLFTVFRETKRGSVGEIMSKSEEEREGLSAGDDEVGAELGLTKKLSKISGSCCGTVTV